MNSNDSPKRSEEDLLALRLHPLHLRMSVQSAISTQDFRLTGADGVPLCADSTSDNENERLRPTSKKGERKKKDDGENFLRSLFNMC